MPLKPVDEDIDILVGPVIDDTDFRSPELAIAFNEPGMACSVIQETHHGLVFTTNLVLANGIPNDYGWSTAQHGYYLIRLPAAGAGFDNDLLGTLRIVGRCNGVLPFSSAVFDIVPQSVYAAFIDGNGAWNTGNVVVPPTVAQLNARTRLDADYFSWATDTVARVTLVDTTTLNSDMRGSDVVPPTVAQLNARTRLDADYFSWATDPVANVTLVDTTTTNTDLAAHVAALAAHAAALAAHDVAVLAAIAGIAPGAGVGAAGAYLANLVIARDNLTLALATESLDPRPNYTVGGRTMSWAEFRMGITVQLDQLNVLILKEQGAVQISTIALS